MASELNFEIYQSSENVEEAYEIFANDISNAYDQSYTIIKMKKKLLDVTKPYINLEIKEQIERKHTLQKKYRKYPVTYGQEQRKVRNDLKNKITQEKKEYYQNKLKPNSADTKARGK